MIPTSIFIVTYSKDFPYLKYCLASIEKFATGFEQVCILVPTQDYFALRELVAALPGKSGIPINCYCADEWEGKGMNWHQAQIMRAPAWCGPQGYIAHFDADCIFTAPVTPDTFCEKGKPVLRYERFDTIGRRHPGVLNWKDAAERCLPFQAEFETMRGHPEIYKADLYSHARQVVQDAVRQPMDDYIRQQRNEYPQTFCEFVTLGNVAMTFHADDYALFDCATQANPDFQPWPVQQFWSHGAIDQPQDIWVRGEKKVVVPIDFIKSLGL